MLLIKFFVNPVVVASCVVGKRFNQEEKAGTPNEVFPYENFLLVNMSAVIIQLSEGQLENQKVLQNIFAQGIGDLRITNEDL